MPQRHERGRDADAESDTGDEERGQNRIAPQALQRALEVREDHVHGSVADIPAGERAAMMASSVARRYGRALNPFRAKPEPLTETYLRDPTLRARLAR
jgi:hypothetical protein